MIENVLLFFFKKRNVTNCFCLCVVEQVEIIKDFLSCVKSFRNE